MKTTIVVSILILIPSFCFAQEKSANSGNRYEKVFKHNHISFTIANNWVQKAKTKNSGGPYNLGAQTMRGWEAGVNYHIHLTNKSYSFIIGLHGIAAPRNYDLFISKGDFTPPTQEDYVVKKRLTRTFDMYFSLPLLFEKRWQVSHNNHWNLNAGIAIGFYPDEIHEGWSSSIINGQPPAFRMDLLVSSNFRPWFNYLIHIGHSWALRNNNLLRVNLQTNYTSFNLAKGEYQIIVPGKPVSSGTYASRLSAAGVSFNYILTSSRKKILKAYKKELKKSGF